MFYWLIEVYLGSTVAFVDFLVEFYFGCLVVSCFVASSHSVERGKLFGWFWKWAVFPCVCHVYMGSSLFCI